MIILTVKRAEELQEMVLNDAIEYNEDLDSLLYLNQDRHFKYDTPHDEYIAYAIFARRLLQ